MMCEVVRSTERLSLNRSNYRLDLLDQLMKNASIIALAPMARRSRSRHEDSHISSSAVRIVTYLGAVCLQ